MPALQCSSLHSTTQSAKMILKLAAKACPSSIPKLQRDAETLGRSRSFSQLEQRLLLRDLISSAFAWIKSNRYLKWNQFTCYLMLEMDVACMKMLISLSCLIFRLVKFIREMKQNTLCRHSFIVLQIHLFCNNFIHKNSFFYSNIL